MERSFARMVVSGRDCFTQIARNDSIDGRYSLFVIRVIFVKNEWGRRSVEGGSFITNRDVGENRLIFVLFVLKRMGDKCFKEGSSFIATLWLCAIKAGRIKGEGGQTLTPVKCDRVAIYGSAVKCDRVVICGSAGKCCRVVKCDRETRCGWVGKRMLKNNCAQELKGSQGANASSERRRTGRKNSRKVNIHRL